MRIVSSQVHLILVCPLSREGEVKRRTATVSGACLKLARLRKERRYPELVGDQGRARLVVLAGEVRGALLTRDGEVPEEPRFRKSRGTPKVAPRRGTRGVDSQVEFDVGLRCLPFFRPLSAREGHFSRSGRSHAVSARGDG